MIGPQQERLAAKLLAVAPGPRVADALMPVAQIDKRGIPVAASVTADVATAQAALGVGHALTLARSQATDPAILAKLAKQPQKAVRLALAGNRNTPSSTLWDLFAWSTGADVRDHETWKTLAGTLPPQQYLPKLRERLRPDERVVHYDSVSRKARNYLIRTEDQQAVWDAFALGNPFLNGEIVGMAANGLVPVPAGALLRSVTDPDVRATLVAKVLNSVGGTNTLDDDTVDLVCDLAENYKGAEQEWRLHATFGKGLTDYALTRFIRSGHPVLMHGAATGLGQNTELECPPDLLAQLAATTNPSVAQTLLGHDATWKQLSAEQVSHLAAHASSVFGIVKAILVRHGGDLGPDVVVKLLRRGAFWVTEEWATGTLPVAPRPEQLADLVAEPGDAFEKANGKVGTIASIDEALWHFRDALTWSVYDNPGVKDLLNAAGTATLTMAATPDDRPNAALRYLGDRLTERFGDDPRAWRAITQLGQHFTAGTIDDLMLVLESLVESDPGAEPVAG